MLMTSEMHLINEILLILELINVIITIIIIINKILQIYLNLEKNLIIKQFKDLLLYSMIQVNNFTVIIFNFMEENHIMELIININLDPKLML